MFANNQCLIIFLRKYGGTDYFDASDGQMASINEVASAIDSNIYQETDSPVSVSGVKAGVTVKITVGQRNGMCICFTSG